MRLLRSLFLSAFILLIAALPAFAGGDQASGALIELLHNKGVLDDASYGELRNAGQGGESKLLDVLYKKGVIDEATYKDLSAKAVAEAKAPAAPQASAAPAERPLDQVLTAMEEGFVKLGGPVYYERLAAAYDKKSTLPTDSLRAEVDKLFTAMHKDGRLAELSKKWFKADLTQPPSS